MRQWRYHECGKLSYIRTKLISHFVSYTLKQLSRQYSENEIYRSFKSFEEINHSVPSFQRIIDINVYHYYWVSFFLVNYIWQLKFIENWGLWSTQYGLQLLCRKHAWVYYIIISNCQLMNQHHLDVTEEANIDESMLQT